MCCCLVQYSFGGLKKKIKGRVLPLNSLSSTSSCSSKALRLQPSLTATTCGKPEADCSEAHTQDTDNHNPCLLCVGNLPEGVAATELLESFNQILHDSLCAGNDVDEDRIIKNILVHQQMAILKVASPRMAEEILNQFSAGKSQRQRICYQGNLLQIRRPKNFQRYAVKATISKYSNP